MNLFQKYLLLENENNEIALKESAQALDFYKYFFDFFSKKIEFLLELTTKKLIETKKMSCLLILNRLRTTAQAIRVLDLMGYYDEALVLERSFYEGLGVCSYLSENEDEAIRWWKGKKLKINYVKSLNLLKKLLLSPPLDETINLGTHYGLLSDYVHGKIRSVVSFIESDSKELLIDGSAIYQLRVTQYNYNKKNIDTLPEYPVLLILVLLEIFNDEVIIKKDNKILPDFVEFFTKCVLFLDSRKKTK